MRNSLLSKSEEQTRAAGKNLGKTLTAGDVVLLYGEIGAGKTVFAQGLCEGLGVKEPVRSPTFALINEYCGENMPVRHADLYRVDGAGDFETIGLFDPLFEGATIVEWAEKLPGNMKGEFTLVKIEPVSQSQRDIVIEKKRQVV